MYKNQALKLASRPDEKDAVIQSEKKLQYLRYVDFFDNLTEEAKSLSDGKLHNFIPWRVQWNLNCLTTRWCLIFFLFMDFILE